jgi:hypothetical protein
VALEQCWRSCDPERERRALARRFFFNVGVFFGFGFVLVGVTFTSASFYRQAAKAVIPAVGFGPWALGSREAPAVRERLKHGRTGGTVSIRLKEPRKVFVGKCGSPCSWRSRRSPS